MSALRRFWPVLFLALLPLIPLWRAVFLGEAIGPFDQIRQMAPWNGPDPGRPWDVLQADAVLQFYPWRDLVFEAWREGQLPFWNPYQLAGTPLLANSQSAGFYPPHVLMGLLHVPTAAAITLLAWLHLFWASFGAYALARQTGASKTGGAIAGAAFGTSAFLLAWTPLASVPTTVAWIPWALYACLRLFDASEIRAAAMSAAGFALSFAMMLLGGHLQFAAFGCLAVGLGALWRVGSEWRAPKSWGRLALLALACILGGLLAAPQVMPALAFGEFAHRRNVPTEDGYRAFHSGSLHPMSALGVPFPSVFGNPAIPAPGEPRLSTYWPALSKRGDNFAESAIGLGPVAFLGLLAAFTFGAWKRTGIWLALGALSLLLAFGSPLNRLLYFAVPGWSSTGSPGRAVVLFVLAGAVLAGVGWSRLSEEGAERPRRAVAAAFAIFAAAALALASLAGGSSEAWMPGVQPEAVRRIAASALADAMPIAALLLVSLSAVCLLPERWRSATPAAALALSALAPPLLLGPAFVPTGDPSLSVRDGLPKAERVAAVNDRWHLLAAAAAVLPPNTASILRLHDLGGYDSLMHRDSVALMHDVSGEDAAPEANGNIQFLKPRFDPEKLRDAGVSEVWSREPLPQLGEPVVGLGGLLRYRIPGAARASTPAGKASIVLDGFDRQTIEAVGPGRLVVRDRTMPGWSASVDGKPAPLLGTLWREVELPPGKHVVEFRYTPPGLSFWPPVAGLTGVLALALLSRRATIRAKNGLNMHET